MRKVKVFCESNTYFVREGNFVFPAFDGEPNFSLATAMTAIGGVKTFKNAEWNVELSAPELASYLSEMQASCEDPSTVRGKWAREHCLRRVEKVPFVGRKVDWDALMETVESMVAKEFPLCV